MFSACKKSPCLWIKNVLPARAILKYAEYIWYHKARTGVETEWRRDNDDHDPRVIKERILWVNER